MGYFIVNGGGDRVLQYQQGGSKYQNKPYWKINSGQTGKRW